MRTLTAFIHHLRVAYPIFDFTGQDLRPENGSLVLHVYRRNPTTIGSKTLVATFTAWFVGAAPKVSMSLPKYENLSLSQLILVHADVGDLVPVMATIVAYLQTDEEVPT